MTEQFSGEPLTRWNGPRNMILMEDFYYIDPNGKKWLASKNAHINGATIPRFLWSTVGSPYTGKYRKSSIVHDVAVGELCNPRVTIAERKLGDKMFYHACRFEGCNQRLALTLYVGVRLGTAWSACQSNGLEKKLQEFSPDTLVFNRSQPSFAPFADQGLVDELDFIDDQKFAPSKARVFALIARIEADFSKKGEASLVDDELDLIDQRIDEF